MKLLWKRHKLGEKSKKEVVVPEDLALCVKRILEERENQCKFNGVPFEGMTLEEVSKEVCLRLGNGWTVGRLKRSGLKF